MMKFGPLHRAGSEHSQRSLDNIHRTLNTLRDPGAPTASAMRQSETDAEAIQQTKPTLACYFRAGPKSKRSETQKSLNEPSPGNEHAPKPDSSMSMLRGRWAGS